MPGDAPLSLPATRVPLWLDVSGTARNRAEICWTMRAIRAGCSQLPWVWFVVILLVGLGGVKAASAQATAVFSYAQSVVGGSLTGPGGVALDRSGNLYIADAGGNIVLEVPPTDRTCSTPSDCTSIASGAGLFTPYDVALDVSGNIYIADYNNHRVLKVPPTDRTCSTPSDCPAIGTGYTLAFNGPIGLTVDASGNVYVVEHLNDFVLKIPPTDQNCTVPSDCTQIASGISFDLPNGVALDAAGNVYVSSHATLQQPQDFVEKVPPTDLTCSTPSDCTTIVNDLLASTGEALNDPWGISVDSNNNIYIVDSNNARTIRVPPTDIQCASLCTTVGNGMSFPAGTRAALMGNVYIADTDNARELREQTQGVSFDAVPVGTTSIVYSLTYTFTGAGTLSGVSVLTQGAAGLDFADAGTGTCTTNGTSHVYAVGDTCTVDVHVTPALTGLRQGAAQLKDASGKIIATGYVYVVGSGPQVAFSPPVQSQLASHLTLDDPVTLAVDSSGNVFIADTINNRVLKVPPTDPTCSTPSDCTLIGSHLSFNQVSGVAVDGSGNVYIADYRHNRVVKVPPSDPTCVVTADCPAVGSGLTLPFGVAVNGGGDLYITNGNNTVLEVLPVDPTCLIPGYCTLWGSGFNFPTGIAVDVNGNVYVADTINNRVLKVPPFDQSCSTGGDCVNVGGSLVSTPRGLGLDSNSNLYIAQDESILKVPAADQSCSVSGDCTTFGSGFLLGPSGAAVDSLGNLYIADSGNNRVLKEDYADPPSLTFAATEFGMVSSPQTVTVENIGNSTLTFPPPASGQNPSISLNFILGSSVTCPVLNPSSAPGTLAAQSSCLLPISFAPTTVGVISGSAVLTDDSLNVTTPNYATQTIALDGTGIQASQTIDFTPPPSPVPYNVGPITLMATASSGLPVTFSILSGPGTINGNILTVTGVGTIVIAANQAGNADYSAAPQVTQSVVVIQASQTITFTPPPSPVIYGIAPISLMATASSGLPVTFSILSGPGTINGNIVTVTGLGTIVIAANQGGNADYTAAPQVAQSIVVVVGTLTVTANNATRVYGTPNPTFTGSITGAVDGDTFTEIFSTTATITSPVGKYAIVPAAKGTNLANYAVIIVNGTLTITQAASSTTLSASASSLTPGENLTLTAQVKSATTGTPTGNVQFLDGTTLLGTTPLIGGMASFATTTLSAGTHSLTAAYQGDTNFTVSTSSPAQVTVAALNFTLTAVGPVSQSVTPGGAVTYMFQVAPTDAIYPGVVTFTATGLPGDATATFVPASVPANGGKQTGAMKVQTAAATAKNFSPLTGETAPFVLALLALPLASARRLRNSGRRLGHHLMLLLLIAVAVTGLAFLSGCGSRNGFFAVTNYPITITATSGPVQHSLVVNLELQ
ncbi:MAG TPA: Ig-like domain repeat protein [Terriglobales bacterium]|nr:Ig-like domain repeat protein [Terriglobales bacterium]